MVSPSANCLYVSFAYFSIGIAILFFIDLQEIHVSRKTIPFSEKLQISSPILLLWISLTLSTIILF